ncbi:unnamed protein product [Choristocarpus tenellus]
MAYGGMHHFPPMEVFQQETSNAVMGALLVRDVNDPATPSNPTLPVKNPLQLFSYGSFHGGVWRMGYTMDSIGTPSVLIYLFEKLLKLLLPLLVVILAILAGMYFVFGEDPVGIAPLIKGEL